jgi:hypothetical protein
MHVLENVEAAGEPKNYYAFIDKYREPKFGKGVKTFARPKKVKQELVKLSKA